MGQSIWCSSYGAAPGIKSFEINRSRLEEDQASPQQHFLETQMIGTNPLSDFTPLTCPPLSWDICLKRPGIPWPCTLEPLNMRLTVNQDPLPVANLFISTKSPSFIPFGQIPLGSVLVAPQIKRQPFSLGVPHCPSDVSNICVTSISAIASKVPYLVALVAPLGARAIVVEMAPVALWQGSPIWLPFACPPCG
ncbi:hypothetical protein Tco_0343267 [Tanacetum coccineum]